MIINFTLFRSKYPDEEIVTGNLKQPIEDSILVTIDTYINRLIISAAKELDIIKKFGLAYVGSIKINSLEITDEDEIDLNEEGFTSYINALFTNVNIIWSKRGESCTKQQEKRVRVKKKE